MKSLPKISIITPSYNQGNFIEETILSVLNQDYPNLEYIVIDGGSKDNTVEILKKYSDKISYWVSEADNGQTHAINKGLTKATGEIIAYINSDDTYCPGAFEAVAKAYLSSPSAGLFHGICRFVEFDGRFRSEHIAGIKRYQEIIDVWGYWWNKKQFVQPEVFWTRKVFERVGAFNESLYFVMDVDYWIRVLREGFEVVTIPQPIANFRFHENQKSGLAERSALELQKILKGYLFERSESLPFQMRFKFRGNWIFDNEVLPMLNLTSSRGARYFKVFCKVVSKPELLFSTRFRSHLLKVLHFDSREN